MGNKIPSLPPHLEKVIHTNSLCEIPKYLEEGQRARLFVLIRNPSVHSGLVFASKKDLSSPNFDERAMGIGFSTYLTSPLAENNPLTRAILCKQRGKITDKDYLTAKKFLERYANLEFFRDRKKIISTFLKTFGLKSTINI